MLIPERLWRPAAKDLQADFNPQVFQFQKIASSVAATLQTGLGLSFNLTRSVPTDKILQVQHVSCIATPGAAEQVTRLQLDITDQNGLTNLVRLAFRVAPIDFTAANAASVYLDYRGHPFLFTDAGQNLIVQADKSAAVQSMALEFYVAGFLIPRGNWQLA